MQKQKMIAWAAAKLVRLISRTLYYRITDMAGIIGKPHQTPLIWAFWHNRLFGMACIYPRFAKHRKGAILVSASKDGALATEFMKHIGLNGVRGSSSRRGGQAFLELTTWLERKMDVAITPDGPRGPRYKLSPGVVRLAQKTGVPVMIVDIKFARCIRLKSWDRFAIPLPFSTLEIRFRPPVALPITDSDEAFEEERLRLETKMKDWCDDPIETPVKPR